MGLFSFTKKQLLSVIEWKDDSKDTIAYRYPLSNRDEIMNSSTLVVREGQMAVFVHKGEVADIFGAGTYKLSTENIPFLTKMLSLPTGFNSRIKAEIYFINTKQFIGQKWGTQNPVMMRDADFGLVRLRGYGIFSFKVDNAKTFMKEMFGTNAVFKTEDVAVQCKPLLLQGISDAIAESKISAIDLAANYREFSSLVKEQAQEEFKKFGLELCSVVIENLSLPEEVEKAIDERAKLGVLGDKMETYMQYKSANAMEESAKNPNGGNMAGIGVGLGAGAVMGEVFSKSVSRVKDEPKQEKRVCKKCGAEISNRVKFCPECGTSQIDVCPKCKEPVHKGSKFCSNCGASLVKEKKCKKCGKVMKATAKFCDDCGEKL